MAFRYTCSRCGKLVLPTTRTCPHCGIPLVGVRGGPTGDGPGLGGAIISALTGLFLPGLGTLVGIYVAYSTRKAWVRAVAILSAITSALILAGMIWLHANYSP